MGLSLEKIKIIEQRRNEVERRTKDNQTAQQIVDALKGTPLETSKRTVEKDQKFLRDCGRLENVNEEERVAKEMQAIKELVEAGKKNEEIAQIRGVSVDTVINYKKRLREQGDLKVLSIEEKMQRVKELTEAEKTIEQIEEETGFSKTAIKGYRKKLREQGQLTGDEKSKGKATIEKEKRMEETQKLVNSGKNEETIAKKQGVSIGTVKKDKGRLREENRLTVTQPEIINKNKNLKKLQKILDKDMENGIIKTNLELAEQMGTTISTIVRYKRILKEQKISQMSERVKKIYENFYGQTDTIEKFEEYLTLCKERYEQKMIDEKDLIAIKCAAISTQRYENIAFYLKLCIRFNQFEEAIKFAHDYVNCETFSQDEKEKIKKSKEECQRYFKAINMIKQKNKEEQTKGVSRVSDDEIMEISGVSKVELAILKKKAGQQVEEDKKTIRTQEENDDGDGPSL